MKNTKELTYSFQRKRFKEETIIQTHWGLTCFKVVLFMCWLGFWGFIFKILIQQSTSDVFEIGSEILFLVTGIVVYLAWDFFLDPEYNYRMKINKDYIEIKNRKIPWQEIADTGIIHIPTSRYQRNYLVVIEKNGAVEEHNLRMFSILNRDLATLIEYYKAKNEEATKLQT